MYVHPCRLEIETFLHIWNVYISIAQYIYAFKKAHIGHICDVSDLRKIVLFVYPSNGILAGLPLIDFQCALPPPNQNLLWILISQLVKVTSHASKGVTAHWWGGEKMQQFPFSRNATSRVIILLSILPTRNFFVTKNWVCVSHDVSYHIKIG